MAVNRKSLIVMGKPPLAGRVKTRLSRDIGRAIATSFYRHSVERVLHRLGQDPRWQTHLAVNAAGTERYACWPGTISRISQGAGDLGARMAFAMAQVGSGPVIVIGTDSPQIEPKDIVAAFDALNENDAVFGPAEDGGYWLIGLARRQRATKLFENVRWSSETTLQDTIDSLPASFRIAHLQTMTDVDEGADLSKLTREWGELRRGPWTRVAKTA